MTKQFKDSKDPGESVRVKFEFGTELTAVDSATVAISIEGDGVDPNMAAMLIGPVQIVATDVYQRVSAGVDGVNYRLYCLATGGDDVIARAAVMAVRHE